MNYSAQYLIKVLKNNGFEFKRSKGSHHIYENLKTKKITVVPVHGSRDLPKGTFYSILKQAGIDKDQLK
ncbi:MAG: type II toxin-antitoxin system HicA family toxin [Cyclobacteriaceae bacterium]|nr:type II toxin-antitoxin system HicA family toxin [Cytophagales bacterium]MBX2900203.1 type II toxin-antitoxin system HicA family toxin [Cyclobacteriaceae bacterium]